MMILIKGMVRIWEGLLRNAKSVTADRMPSLEVVLE